jgi:putative hydrolase of HD superfamily
MQTKSAAPITYLPEGSASPILRAYFEFNQLKQLYRQGWLRRGVPPERCETVAEHSFGVALLGLIVARARFPQLDEGKVLRMALLHDFGEIYAGDFTPADAVNAAEKHRLEAESVQRVLGQLAGGAEWIALWHEYEDGQSGEARLVRQLDRLEMALQAAVYERQEGLALDEFFASAGAALESEPLLALLAELQALG